MASIETITKMLERFSIAFAMPEITEAALETWALALDDISDEMVQAATVHFIKTWGSQFNRKPRPGDIREFQAQAQESSWADAWQEVQTLSAACVQPDCTVQFSSPEIRQACQSVGGLRAVFECDTDQLPTIRAQFRDALKTIRAQNQARNIVQRVTTPRVELPGMEGNTVIQLKPGQTDLSDELKTIRVLPEPKDDNWHAYAKAQREQAPVVDFAKLMARRAQ